MITHIVCWKYKEETTAEQRSEHINALNALNGVIPELISLEAGADFMHLDRSFDTGMISYFADRNDLDAYTVHPEHQKVIAIGKEIAKQAISVDFVSSKTV